MITSQIETIVREVIRRLQAESFRLPAADPTDAPRSSPRDELACSERLVTLASLDGRLDGIRRVVVGAHAVITPAVHDELRSRGIQLVLNHVERTDDPRSGGWAIAAWKADFDVQPLARRYAAHIVTCLSEDGVLRQLGEFAQRADSRGGIVFSDRPISALSGLNGVPGMRAFWAPDRAAVHEAAELNAHVMVISPMRHEQQTIEQLVDEFVLLAASP